MTTNRLLFERFNYASQRIENYPRLQKSEPVTVLGSEHVFRADRDREDAIENAADPAAVALTKARGLLPHPVDDLEKTVP